MTDTKTDNLDADIFADSPVESAVPNADDFLKLLTER